MHKQNLHESKSAIFTCTGCKKEITTERGFLRHMQDYHNPTHPHKCKMCQQTFPKEFELESHYNNKHLHCERCPITFEKRHEAVIHMNKVHNVQVIQTVRLESTKQKKVDVACPICGERFGKFRNLKHHHIMVHDKSRAYSCPNCSKCFPIRNQMIRHIKHVHEKAKSFKCKLCDKEFPQQQNLDKHITGVHQKLKPFECDLCHNFFAQTSSLYLHKKNIHKIGGKQEAKSSPSDTEESEQTCGTTDSNLKLEIVTGPIS